MKKNNLPLKVNANCTTGTRSGQTIHTHPDMAFPSRQPRRAFSFWIFIPTGLYIPIFYVNL